MRFGGMRVLSKEEMDAEIRRHRYWAMRLFALTVIAALVAIVAHYMGLEDLRGLCGLGALALLLSALLANQRARTLKRLR